MTPFKRLASASACLSLLFLSLLAGCSTDEMLDKFASDEDKTRASAFIQSLRDGRIDVIESSLDDSLKKPDLRATLERMHQMIPKGQPESVKLVGVIVNHEDNRRWANLTYQFQFGERWFLINCATFTEAGSTRIVGINVTPMAKSLEEQNRFTLNDKTAVHYAVLGTAALVLAISVWALVACAREKGLRRKWLWIVFILLGFCQLTLDWTTGAWEIKPLSFLLFSAGALSNGYGPFLISVALPLGAIVYLIRRVRNQNALPQSNPEPSGS